MIHYECIVYDKSGERRKVKLSFASKEDLNSYINMTEDKIISIKEDETTKSKKINNKELSIICKQLGMLLASGCEITQSIENIKSNCNKNIKTTLKNIDYYLRNGNSISDSFQQTNKFSNFFVNMIKAGEISGRLDEILLNLSDYYKKEYEFKKKIQEALMYPIFLVVAILAVIILMLIYVIPNFETSFSGMGIDLPTSTKMLMILSKILRDYYVIIITLLIVSIYGFCSNVLKSKKLKTNIEEKLFKFKATGILIQQIEITKFTRALYVLLSSGVHIVDSLEISSKTISNSYMYNKLYISKENLEKGMSISQSLGLSGVFPELFISMLKVGEETGRLDECLKTIMISYESDIDNLIQKILKVIGPGLIVLMTIIVGVIAISLMVPMFNAVTAI
ncbi:MAG: type II secretion system F family protein [Paraclostridium sp.]